MEEKDHFNNVNILIICATEESHVAETHLV